MLVYEGTKSEFCNSVLNDTISDEIYSNYQKKIGNISKKEISSWSDSMQYMYKVVQSEELPNNCGIAIEFRIPSTSKRVDFIISGKYENKSNLVVIIELKFIISNRSWQVKTIKKITRFISKFIER